MTVCLFCRRIWATYFKENKIRYIFWSAVNAQKIIEEEHKRLQAEANEAALALEALQRAADDEDDEGEIEVIEEEEDEDEDDDDLYDDSEEDEVDDEDEEGHYEDEEGGGRVGENDEDQWEDYESGGEEEEEGEDEDAVHEEALNAQQADGFVLPFELFLFFLDRIHVFFLSSLDVCAPHSEDDIRVLTREELLERLVQLCPPKKEDQRNVIGFVGYPNVGKSSTINVLYLTKKVTVSSTPGKTKHFQTLNIEPNITLCDCPGLVFPNFAATKAEMVCNGILPIDQLKDPFGPSALVAQRIPRKLVEAIYGIKIIQPAEGDDPNRKPTAAELLGSYASEFFFFSFFLSFFFSIASGFIVMRGYMRSGFGGPDEQRAARAILKDYVNVSTPSPHFLLLLLLLLLSFLLFC